jgi:hypothetical protein
MSTISGVGKVSYIYNKSTDTWHPIAGYTNTSEDYTWYGFHNFTQTVNFDVVLNAKAGVNNFASTIERDQVLTTSPAQGTVAFIRSSNQLQYYSGTSWRLYGDNAQLLSKTTSFVLSLADAGRTQDIESASSVTVTIPTNATLPFPVGTQIAFIQTGAGQVVFNPEIGPEPENKVTLLSKNNNTKIAARYSPATLIKKSANTWILIGDLTA